MQRLRILMPYLLIILLIVIVFARLHVALARAFDPDEFAHLHWTYLIVSGKLPYRDFFFYIAPVYQWFLTPFFLLPHVPNLLLFIRTIQYFLYLISVFLVYLLSKRITSNRVISLTSAITYVLFPMTFDKTIDIRPDMLMVDLFLLSVYMLLAVRTWTKKLLFFWGFIVGLSILVIFKLVFALPALALLTGIAWYKRVAIGKIIFALIGFIIPGIFFIFYLTLYRISPHALDSIISDSFAVNTGKMPFSLFVPFSPWPLVYVDHGGVSWPWLVNTILWITGMFGLMPLYRKSSRIGIFLAVVFLSGGTFLYFFPVPYMQYFLPFTPFISILSAVFFSSVGAALRVRNVLLAVITLTFSLSFWQQYRLHTIPGNTHYEQFGVLRNVLSLSKSGETWYDLVGSYVFRPDGYYLCCHPYGEFISELKRPPPPLSESLVKNQTRFLLMDRTGLIFWKTPEPDLSFLKRNYLPSAYPKIYTVGVQFRCDNGKCTQYSLDNAPVTNTPSDEFSIVAEDTYKLNTDPQGAKIVIDSHTIEQNPIQLTRGMHTFSVDTSVTSLVIQLDR